MQVDAALPMVFGQVAPYEPALNRFTLRKAIRQAMASADANSGRPEALPRVKMVSTDGYPLQKDTVHYNAAGQLKLGQAMAEVVKALLAAPAR